MRTFNRKCNSSGSAIIFALLFSTILTISVGGYLIYVTGQSNIINKYSNSNKAFYLAEAGLNKAVVRLEQYSSYPKVFPGIKAESMGDGTYEVSAAQAVYDGDSITYEIHSVGTVGEETREIVVYVQAESFAKWSYFTDTENMLVHIWWWRVERPVWFTTGSYLEGPVHTNGQYNVSGFPVFNGPVSSVAEDIRFMHGPDEDAIVFYDERMEGYDEERDAAFEADELNLGVEAVDMSNLDADRLKKAAREAYTSGGMQFTGKTEIEFLDDGTMNVTNARRRWKKHNIKQPSAIRLKQGNGIFSGFIDTERISVTKGNLNISGAINAEKIYVKTGNLNVSGSIKTNRIYVDGGNVDIAGSSTIDTTSGAIFAQGGDLTFGNAAGNTTIKGTVTGGASGDVIITDDILYHIDPRINPDSEDKLGVIAERNVIIDRKAPQDSAPNDPKGVTVHASIIAINDSFTVEGYWSGLRGTLTVLGGIIQDRRGPVGTFYATPYKKASGYDKNYQYDKRMRYSPPPYFPYTGEYEVIFWEEALDED